MQVHLKALGCRLNEAELETWADEFQERGYDITQKIAEADIVVLNTCAVTHEAVKKSRQLIRRSHRNNPLAKLVVSGCYASLEPEIKQAMSDIDLVVPNTSKNELVNLVDEQLNKECMPAISTRPGVSPMFARGRHRAFIKIQDGCRYRCTFCIVTVARGNERSRKPEDIIHQINRSVEKGIQEVVLTGVHAGGYGHDLGSDLYRLIRCIMAETDVARLRLGSLEPWDLGDNFLSLFENPRFMPHLHLPLQAGTDEILRRMARRCKTSDFIKLVEQTRAQVPDFNVTTDIIVGFPGETDVLWEKGLAFIEQCNFSHIHIFPYSIRAGTRAADLDGQISPLIKKQRTALLHTLGKKMKYRFLSSQLNRQVNVLFEKNETSNALADNVFSGYSSNYIRVKVDSLGDTDLTNAIRPVHITGVDENTACLMGKPVS